MYFLRLLIAIDQLCNTILGGQPDETISARAWRTRNTLLIHIIDTIFWFDPRHCETSFESETIRKYLPDIYKATYAEVLKNAS